MNRFIQRVRRRTSSLRLHALAALFLLSYVASFAHDVSVRHSLCAAHGEWVHDPTAAEDVGPTLGSDDGTPQIRSAPVRAEGPHEHCMIVVVSRGARWLTPIAPLEISRPVFDGVCDIVADAVPLHVPCLGSTPARGPPTNA